MAEIVLGLGTSHSPQVSQEPKWWGEQGLLDQKRTPYEALLRNRAAWMDGELEPSVWVEKHQSVQRAIEELSAALKSAKPDVVLLIGDDQEELFLDDCIPTFSLFWGKESWDRPEFIHSDMSVPSRAAVRWAFHGDAPEAYPGHPALGRHIVEQLIGQHFDVAQFTKQHESRSLGHAFTFVRRRLMDADRVIPMIPVLINTYLMPNQPSAARCFAFGRALANAIRTWPGTERIAVVASGGLSHFVIDTELDRTVLDGLANSDESVLSSLPKEKLQMGSSEILNWIVAGGALEDLRMQLVAYVPGYRSPGGTGVGMAFARWVQK
jgi:3-O-methylgallate 3,4-dioxygenase